MLVVQAMTASPGPVGPTGPTGPGGGVGPTGPTSPPSIEAGGPVVIGNGSTLTEEQIKAIGTLVATIDSASIPAGAPIPVIEFTLKTSHGGAATGLAPSALLVTVAKLVPSTGSRVPQTWQSYVNRTQTAIRRSEAYPERDPGQLGDRHGRHARGSRRRQVPLHV